MPELKELVAQCRDLKKEVGIKNQELTKLKKIIRIYMIDSGLNEFDGVEIRRSFTSFDLELLRLEKEDLFNRYATREKHVITTFENNISKKNLNLLQTEHPELWNDPDYRKERTAGLYGL